jgi:hypothetical protein
MIIKVKKQSLYNLNLNLPVTDANKAKDAFEVMSLKRANNLMIV